MCRVVNTSSGFHQDNGRQQKKGKKPSLSKDCLSLFHQLHPHHPHLIHLPALHHLLLLHIVVYFVFSLFFFVFIYIRICSYSFSSLCSTYSGREFSNITFFPRLRYTHRSHGFLRDKDERSCRSYLRTAASSENENNTTRCVRVAASCRQKRRWQKMPSALEPARRSCTSRR